MKAIGSQFTVKMKDNGPICLGGPCVRPNIAFMLRCPALSKGLDGGLMEKNVNLLSVDGDFENIDLVPCLISFVSNSGSFSC